MKICFYLNSLSPHQIPLFNEVCMHSGHRECIYIAVARLDVERQECGWGEDGNGNIPVLFGSRYNSSEIKSIVETCSLLFCNVRDFSLFSYRAQHNLDTIYFSERWFKPINLFFPGWIRLLWPSYCLMSVRWLKLLVGGHVKYYGAGVYAVRDMYLLAKILGCGGKIKQGMINLWGYFVAPSAKRVSLEGRGLKGDTKRLSVLYVGRLVRLKHVDVAIKAIKRCKIEALIRGLPMPLLDIYGSGPDFLRLKSLAKDYGDVIRFSPPAKIDEVRQIMRRHDVLVLPSDAHEGWGAVVNEALEEGLRVVGSKEAGSCATMLSDRWLFHSSDVMRLAELLMMCADEKFALGEIVGQGIGMWNVKTAAPLLLNGSAY